MLAESYHTIYLIVQHALLRSWLEQVPSGPLSPAEARELLRLKKLSHTSLGWCDGMVGWKAVGRCPKLAQALQITPLAASGQMIPKVVRPPPLQPTD